ncbi:uncharacterized protein TRIADDRAFT_51956 [Trichoplax adhaerens]|uniref:Choline kinase N-terminal domain-containing protein n=1 Tax=Trichoplax adhaerens TaxID=10228 RepID=B3RLC3_TRIAD|nr:hypothetical protein TRIADDRAFT_51956 [Trichoplax adhaerens]EDV28742.1 hypothetical protein TRIADDRAFT_51956 [Trichoplax adhaerens]|eukprot:XP_002107944.1 hypothetical protein TRIADDRAFT_51956 [Trichoplax adhaerens]
MAETNDALVAVGKENVLNYCKQVIGGIWEKADLTNVQFETVRLSENLQSTNNNEPEKVLIRVYGETAAKGQLLLQESVIVSLLGEIKLAPKIYGFFPGGRFEEFLNGRTLKTSELQLQNVSEKMAVCFANLHQACMPISKKPTWSSDFIDRLFDSATTITFNDKNKQARYEEILSYDLAARRDEIRDILQACNSEACFCHNDLQENNIIVCGDPTSADASFHCIDFEYGGYNYSAFDLANYFCEWCYDYNCDKPPYFTYCLDDYPSDKQQIHFLSCYLKKQYQLKKVLVDEKTLSSELRKLQLEVNRLALASHLLWTIWACVQAKMSNIEFGYLEYSLARLKGYMRQKNRPNLW